MLEESASGGVTIIGTRLVRTWLKTQINIALSLAENDSYTATKAALELIVMSAIGKEFNLKLSTRTLVDASAAIGVAQRQGICHIIHLQTGALGIQEQELKELLKMGKVSGTDNYSDILTKHVPPRNC